MPLSEVSSPSWDVSEVLMGTAAGLHRCTGPRTGGRTQPTWRVTPDVAWAGSLSLLGLSLIVNEKDDNT